MADTLLAPVRNRNGKANQANVATYVIQMDQKGSFYQDPHKGRIEVVTLYCNCGRSILVNSKEVSDSSVMCRRCNSSFRWQQLTFSDL